MSSETLADSNCLFGVLDESVPAHECTHGAHDPIADFFSVYDDLDIGREETLQLVEQTAGPIIDVVGVVRTVLIRDTQFVVIVEIVRCRDDADQTAEVVLPDPDDLFLAADPTVIVAIPTWSLTHRQSILENPSEVPGGDSQSPFST